MGSKAAERDEQVLAHLIRFPYLKITAYQIARKFHGYARQYADSLERLRDRGLVERVSESSPGVAAVYRLVQARSPAPV